VGVGEGVVGVGVEGGVGEVAVGVVAGVVGEEGGGAGGKKRWQVLLCEVKCYLPFLF
jgi:hypothetical protein